MRLRVLVVLLGLVAVLLAVTPIASADPDPAATDPASAAGKTFPKGFPDDLKQFVGGTEEFKSGEWFSGAQCKDKGGSIGQYISDVLTNEKRLMYWTASDDGKLKILSAYVRGSDTEETYKQWIKEGKEPPAESLGEMFPAGDITYHLSTRFCAEDLKRWTTPKFNTWGFEWAKEPDTTSLAEMKKYGNGEVPDAAWTDPCSAGGAYCAHAFFANCDHASGDSDLRECMSWNTGVAQLFRGTAHWIDQNKTFAQAVSEFVTNTQQFLGGAAIASAFGWVWNQVAKVVKFIDDPKTVIDDWANATKDSSMRMVETVLGGLTSIGEFDPSAPWFVRWYAMSCGLGIGVMAVMMLLAVWRAGSKKIPVTTLLADLFAYAPAGVIAMMFAPAFGQMLIEVSNALTKGIANVAGPDMGQMVDNLKRFVGDLSAENLPGGVVVGLLLFLLLIAGCFGILFGVLAHMDALPLLACACGVSFGFYSYEPWRPKALKPVMLAIALIFSKPLLFLLLGVMTGLINAALTGQGAGQGDLGQLGQLCVVVVAFIIAGLAPWSMLKYAPILPSRSDATGFGNSGSLAAGAIGSAGGSAGAFRRGGGVSGGQGRSGRSAGQTVAAASGGGTGPSWRTHGGSNGKGVAQNQLSSAFGSRPHTGSRPGMVGAAGHGASRLGGALGTGAKLGASAGMAAVPIAAQQASAALSKAKASAEAAPGEAEQ